jgi:hypothetical protein
MTRMYLKSPRYYFPKVLILPPFRCFPILLPFPYYLTYLPFPSLYHLCPQKKLLLKSP